MFGRAKLILIIILLITVCVTAYVLVVVIPTQLAQKSYEGARQIGHDISEAFQFTPEITVNNTDT
jgi:flagellar basal body-associated protein FliL